MRLLFKTIVTGIFIFYAFTFNLFAQQPSFQRPPHGVTHPSIFYTSVRLATNIDTVFYYNLTVNSEGELADPFPSITYYTRSEDLLTDTMYIGTGDYPHTLRYNENNQLLYSYGLNPGQPGYMRHDYEYDDEGRVVRIEVNYIKLSKNQTDNPEKEFMYEQTWDYSTIQMTEKGFIYEGIACELDDQGRITLIKDFANGDSIVEYSDGKKYRVNDIFYSYTDSSFTEFGYLYLGNKSYARPGDPVKWIKATTVFNESGHATGGTLSISQDGSNWRLDRSWKQVYKSKTETPSGNDDASKFIHNKTNTTIYAHSGTIVISNGNAATVQIFDLTGRLVKQQALPAGENRISIFPDGFYIVRVGNEAFKVFVK